MEPKGAKRQKTADRRPERMLNNEQLLASTLPVESLTTPVRSTLVVGGPGSGKTEVLIAAVNNALNVHGVAPSSIIVNTYTQTVATELRERLGRSDDDDMHIGTMHSIAYLTMRDRCSEKRLVMSEEESKTLMDMAVSNLGGHTALSHTAIELANAFRSNNKGTHRAEEVFATNRVGSNMARIWEEYCRLKQKYEYLDFDDLLELYRDFLRHSDSQDYRDGIRYVFIDEVQDNSPLQNEILRLLHINGRTHIYAIGDDYQSIYGFRGSDHRSIIALPKILEPCNRYVLEKNYRNPRAVIQVSKTLITSSGCEDREMQCVNSRDEIYESTRNRVPVYRFPFARREWASLVNAVRNDHRAAIEGCPESGRVGTQQPTQLILAKTNSILDGIEEFLNDQGVPYYRQQNKICDMQREFMSLLHIAADKNGHLHTNALNDMGYTCEEIEALQSCCEGADVSAVVGYMLNAVYTREETRVAGFASEFRSDPKKVMHSAFERMDTVPSLAWKDSQNKHTSVDAKFDALIAEHAAHLRHQTWVTSLDRRLRAINEDDNMNHRHFISEINIMKHDGEGSKNMLRLMTIHQSKGLEADYVYVVGAQTRYDLKTIEQKQEEFRMYNVAFTRCIQKLRVSWSERFQQDKQKTDPFPGFTHECFYRANYV